MANCDKRCPVFRQIEQIRAKCLACKVCKDGNTMQANGRGVVYTDSAEDAETVISHSVGKRFHSPDVYKAKDPERNVTALPPDVEEKLRQFTATFFGLKQVEVNLLWHLANGGNLANFADTMERFNADMAKYKHLDKRNAWAIFKHIGQVFAPFRALAGGLIGKGKGGAVKRAKTFEQTMFSFGG